MAERKPPGQTSRMVAWPFPLLLFAAFLPYASTT
jgi:hypothetical protein